MLIGGPFRVLIDNAGSASCSFSQRLAKCIPLNSRNTIDTFSLARIILLTDHPTYIYRRKFVNKNKRLDSDSKICVQECSQCMETEVKNISGTLLPKAFINLDEKKGCN